MAKVSIALASYNGERYIAEQIDSILASLAQAGVADYEILVSDDGSQDKTIDIVKKYISNGSKIKLLKGPQQGVIANFENALQACQGEYVFMSDQDDVWLPQKVQKLLELFEQDPELTCIVHNVEIVDGSLADTGDSFFTIRKSKGGLIYNLIKNRFMGSAMALRRSALAKVLPIPKDVPMHDQWIGLINEIEGKTLFLEDILGLYRRHGDNVSSYEGHGSVQYMLRTRYIIIRDLIQRVMVK